MSSKTILLDENQGLELSKAARKKPRRKKHRPRVVKEGELPKVRKPVTPKSLTPQRAKKAEDKNRVKRKYIWRNKDKNAPEKSMNEVGESSNADGGRGKKPVRRTLVFDPADSEERDGCSASRMLFTDSVESYKDAIVCSPTELDRIFQNPDEHVRIDLNRSPQSPDNMNKLQDDYMSMLNNVTAPPQPGRAEGRNLRKIARKNYCIDVGDDPERSLEVDQVHVISDKSWDVLTHGTKRAHDSVDDAQVSTREVVEVDNTCPEIHKKQKTENGGSEGTCASFGWKRTQVSLNNSEVFTFADERWFKANEELPASGYLLMDQDERTTTTRSFPPHTRTILSGLDDVNCLQTPIKENISSGPRSRIIAQARSRELKLKNRVMCSDPIPTTSKAPSCTVDSSLRVNSVNVMTSAIGGTNRSSQSVSVDMEMLTYKEPLDDILQALWNLDLTEEDKTVETAPMKKSITASHNKSKNLSSSARYPYFTTPQENDHFPYDHPAFKNYTPADQNALVPYNVQENAHFPYYPRNKDYTPADQNALVPYNARYQNFTTEPQNALVPYAMGPGAVVPYTQVKKKKPRAKVDLDAESDRVWNVLMGKESDGQTSADKEKWWDDERRIFKGRVDSFINRMHLIQGDRRFSRWKGSVLDSVIGVYLTQNVSDHLSSSAYMSLAARFPVKPRSNDETQNAEKTSNPVASGDTDQGKVSEQDSSILTSTVVHENGQVDQKEMTNSKNSFESNSESGVEDYPNNEVGSTSAVHVVSSTNRIEGEDRKPMDDVVSSPNSVVSSQNSSEYPIQEANQDKGCKVVGIDAINLRSSDIGNGYNSSFTELLMMANSGELQGANTHHKINDPVEKDGDCCQIEDPSLSNSGLEELEAVGSQCGYKINTINGVDIAEEICVETCSFSQCVTLSNNTSRHTFQVETTTGAAKSREENSSVVDNNKNSSERIGSVKSNSRREEDMSHDISEELLNTGLRVRTLKIETEFQKKSTNHWDDLRKQAFCNGHKKERSKDAMDSIDYEALRKADVNEISHAIRERGMNNLLAVRMKGLLDRLVEDHGSMDMEWLRDAPPGQVKDYLLSIRGLGLKSVECVRLLTLHHLAFPVDTNVGRIAVRLGWVPLQNLPDSLQLHLLELYPVMETIQKYLWPRLCKLDQHTLYELHYQMITFGKVFCTKSKPNCNACPMKGECKHFASAFANSRLLTGPEERSLVSATVPTASEGNHIPVPTNSLPLPQLEDATHSRDHTIPKSNEPIIEEPASPEREPEYEQTLESEIEDAFFYDDPDEIPTVDLNVEEFTQNLQDYMKQNMDLPDGDISKALVALTSEAASIPVPKLKNVSRLRTEHLVYEIPDDNPLLEGMEKRETDDPCPYLLAIWSAGETAESCEAPKKSCNSQDATKLCDDMTCFNCNSIREAQTQTVRGTILIPCRTANRGSFPLNGTYFQVNEVFADHESSRNPIIVPRSLIWNFQRKTVYFGTSVTSIFKGLTTEAVQQCFWKGFVCVRGYDRASRSPKPLYARLHMTASKAPKAKKADAASKEANKS